MTNFNSPDDLYRYITQTIQVLNDIDLPRAAELLENVHGNSYTTGSEWLGELGLAIRAIEAKFAVPAGVQERLDSIMAVVRKALPKI
jgi:hypothetical protein